MTCRCAKRATWIVIRLGYIQRRGVWRGHGLTFTDADLWAQPARTVLRAFVARVRS